MRRKHLHVFHKDKSWWAYFLGMALGVTVVITFATAPVSALLLSAVSVGLLTCNAGVELDFKRKKIRHIYFLGPQKIGIWKRLFCLRNLLIHEEGNSFYLDLYSEEAPPVTLFQCEDKTQCIEKAREFSVLLEVPVWDKTNTIPAE